MKPASLVLAVCLCGALLPSRVASAPAAEHNQTRHAIAGGGTIFGQVSLPVAAPPAARRLPVYKNRRFCGPSVADESLLVSKQGGVRNAVVLLHSLERQATAEPRRVVLDNLRCAFAPHVQVAAVGSEVLLTNSDPILHAVHARIGQETLFNVGLPKGRQVRKVFDKAGIVRINCDVLHTWMSAAIVVTSTPYFAVTGEHGYFMIDDLPPGGYRMEAWHESLGTRIGTLSVTPGSRLSVDIIFASSGKHE